MPAEVFEDSIDLFVDLLDASSDLSPLDACYPYPKLSLRGEQETRRFATIVLENDTVRITIIPALGGRIWSVFDRRTGIETLAEGQTLSLSEGGDRGVCSSTGIQFAYRNSPRLNELGNVDTMILRPDHDDDPAAVLISEVAAGSALGFAIKFELSPNSAWLRVEVSAQNRTLDQAESGMGILFPEPLYGVIGGVNCANKIAIRCEPGTFESTRENFLARCLPGAFWAPRQVESFSFFIAPISGIENVNWLGEAGCASLKNGVFRFQSSRSFLGHNLLVQNSAGEGFEAPLDLMQEVIYAPDFSGIAGEVVAVQLRDSERQVVASIHPNSTESERFSPVNISVELVNVTEMRDDELNLLTANPVYRVAALLELAARCNASGEWAKSDAIYDQALLYNGDDALVWWAKATVRRLSGRGDGEEKTELLNAHFLSPLEPCLRAEAFLSQAQTHGKEPSPLLKPLEECAENFVEIACRLIESKFFVEAGRFIEEAIRHVDLSMLRYLQAYLYLTQSRMEAEAAEQISAGHRLSRLPLPYRSVERKALAILLARFPDDQKLLALQF